MMMSMFNNMDNMKSMMNMMGGQGGGQGDGRKEFWYLYRIEAYLLCKVPF